MSRQTFARWFAWAVPLACLALLAAASVVYAAPQAGGYQRDPQNAGRRRRRLGLPRVDPDAHRIYISRGTHMMVVDEITRESRSATFRTPMGESRHGPGARSGQGIHQQRGRQYGHRLRLEDAEATSEIKTTGENPDSIIYDPMTKRVFTFNGKSMQLHRDRCDHRESRRHRRLWAASRRSPRSTARATCS